MAHFKTRKLRPLPLEKRLMLDASLPALTGMVLWLDAADATKVLDAEGDAASSGAFSGSVKTWVDKSSSANNVTAAATGNEPVYTAAGLNGKGVITFDGTTDSLINSTMSLMGDDFTAFVIFNRTTGTGRDAIFELGGGGSRNGLYVNEGGTSQLNYYHNSIFSTLSGTYTPGTYTLSTIIHDTTTMSAWTNAGSAFSGTVSGRTDTTGLYIGDDSTSGDQLQGNIAEIIIYNRDLTSDQRHDVETYLAAKWGLAITNAPPVVDINAGVTLVQGGGRVINSLVLAASDPDNSDTTLIYTLTDVPDYGTLTNLNTGQVLSAGSTFTQSDISGGYIRYAHNGSSNLGDSFSYTVSDQYQSTAPHTFNLTMTSSNQAPVIERWTLASSENFESGASGWSDTTTETSNPYLTRFLGRHSLEGGAQNTYKTYALSGTQDYVAITFDFYEIDSWDGENFIVYVNDAVAYSGSFSQSTFNTVTPGSSGIFSWSAQTTTPLNVNYVYGSWTDQCYKFTLIVDSSAASLKLGFSSTLNQAASDEAWGVDNIKIYEVGGSGVPGPLEVVENSANGTVVGQVTAVDPNALDTITYSITGGTGAGIFAINPSTGVITVANSAMLNYESVTSYTLTVRASDDGTPILSDTRTLTINVLDMPENTAPVIAAAGPFTVAEDAANGTLVGTVTASDAEGHAISYNIAAGNGSGIFSINSTTGEIRIANNANLNYETGASYTLTIQAVDNGFGALSSSRTVTVNISNVNEAPSFSAVQAILTADPTLRYNAATGNFYKFVNSAVTLSAAQAAAAAALVNGVGGHVVTVTSAAENTFVTGLITANVWMDGSDSATEGQWRWASGPNAGQMFWLGTSSGSVQNGLYANWMAAQPDDSGGAEDALQLRTNGQWNDVSATLTQAYVIEWEGTAVLASLQNGPYTIAENSASGSVVGSAHSSDPDVGDTRVYAITGGSGAGLFAINATTGQITTTTSTLNYEAVSSYTLDLIVTDAGGLSDTVTVTINVGDVNEAPTLSPAGPFTFAENTAAGTAITTLTATDPDGGQTLTYSIVSGNTGGLFAVNAASGVLSFAAAPNYEAGTSYTLVVRATDNGTGALFSQQSVTVTITDVNEAPVFDPVQQVLASDPTLRYSAASGNFYRYVNSAVPLATARAAAAGAMLYGTAGHVATPNSAAENAFLTSLITQISWIDGSDAAVEGSWRWASGPEAGPLFWLGNGSGSAQNGLYTNWAGGEPNDSGGNEDGVHLRLNGTWNDINVASSYAYVIEWEGAAILASLQNGPYTVAENSAAGTVVGSAHANDPDAGDTRAFTITGGSGAGLFAIDAATGQITVTGALNYEAASSYTLDLRVTDAGGLFDSRTVTINITDVNETPTISPAGPFTVAENTAAGTVVTTMSATDPDGGQTLTYSIVSGNGDGIFAINAATGALRFVHSPDYEYDNSYTLVIRATDNGAGNLYSETTVSVAVTDVNEAPIFDPVQQVLSTDPTLRYNAATGNFYKYIPAGANFAAAQAAAGSLSLNGVAGHLATITSAGENAFVTGLISAPVWIGGSDAAVEGEWRWLGGPEAGAMFWLGTQSGSAQNGYYTNWAATEPNNASPAEDGIQLRTNGTWYDVLVSNSMGYVVEWEGASIISALQQGPYSITENSAAGTSLGFALARDPDAGDTVAYSITGGSGAGIFNINSATGELTLSGAVDFETASTYTLILRASDTGGLFDTKTVTININDINEAPVLAAAGPLAFNENIAAGTAVTTMTSAEQDAGQNVTYTIQSGNTGGMFTLDPTTGALVFAGSPDHELQSSYTLVIRATDDGPGALYTEQTVIIGINDLNETPTLNPAGPFSVNENVPAGTVVTTMTSSDPDNGQSLFYSIQSGNTGNIFTINAATGALSFVRPPDYEDVNSYTLVIRVTDNGSGTLFDEQSVTIAINDLNDPPSDILLTHNRVKENVAAGTMIGSLSSIDQDPGDTHTYTIVSNPFGRFALNGDRLVTAGAIDYERNQTLQVVIRSTDSFGNTYDKPFTIYIDDEQDTFTPLPQDPASPPPQREATSPVAANKAPSLLLDTLRGGEFGQMASFYGMDDFHQILRENVLYEIHDRTGEDPDSRLSESRVPELGPAGQRTPSDAEGTPDRFTNLREALKFYEQIRESEAGPEMGGSEKADAATPVPARDLPGTMLDRQFVDVLTYHEQRQARLRDALRG